MQRYCLCIIVVVIIVLLLPGFASSQVTYKYNRLWPALKHPWFFNAPENISIDSQGNVYVADTANNQIQKFTADGQFVTKWGIYGSGDGGFDYPRAVAVDSEGDVYVVDRENHRIQKFTADGSLLGWWGKDDLGDTGWHPPGSGRIGAVGSGDGAFNIPSCLAIDSDNNVYVADSLNHRVQKFTSNGTLLGWWGKDDLGGTGWHLPGSGRTGDYGYDAEEFFGPSGIAIYDNGDDEYVYVSDTNLFPYYFSDRIQKFNTVGEYQNISWGGFGSNDGEFYKPSDIAIDNVGNVYVADTKNHRIQKFTSDGNLLGWWGKDDLGGTGWHPPGSGRIGMPGSRDGEFDHPRGIALDNLGNVYVAERVNARIQKFTTIGDFEAKWTSRGSGDGRFALPYGVAIDSNGENVYVADTYNDRIQKFTADGIFIGWWGKDDQGGTGWHDPGSGRIGATGSGNGEFNKPAGIAVDNNDNVYVADTNDRIQKFTANGQFDITWGSQGWGDGGFSNPEGIAVDNNDNVYVADTHNHRIQKFTSVGTLLGWWGKDDLGGTGWHPPDSGRTGVEGSGDGEFHNPSGIAIDDNDNAYVADKLNHRIQKFTSSGTLLGWWGKDDLGAIEWHPPGSGRSPVSGEEEGAFAAVWHIDVSSEGYVFVADRNNERIQVFEPDGNGLAFYGTFGTWGTRAGQLRKPAGVAVNPADGKIYVTDRYNHRLQVFKKVDAPLNPRAIIVAGRESATEPLWSIAQACTNFAYNALLNQGLTDNDINYLSAGSTLDLVDGDSLSTNLESAITQWAVNEGADSLILYMNDHGGTNTFRLHESKQVGDELVDGILHSSDLASWLDVFQAQTAARVTVVYEACKSGSFADDLEADNRIIITSTLPGEQAKFLAQGTVSYSSFFWTNIFNGLSIEEAHLNASQMINFSFTNQNPQLIGDADDVYIGNGVGNMIGEAPAIGSVSEPQEITSEETSAIISAYDVTDADGIDEVWAVIWPPNFYPGEDPLLDSDVPPCKLLPIGGNDYQGTCDGLESEGTYRVTIYAMDRNNNTSLPQLTTVSKNYSVARRAIIIAGGGSATLRSMIETNAALAYNALTSQLYEDDDILCLSVTDFDGIVRDSIPSNDALSGELDSLKNIPEDNLDLTIYLIGEGDAGTFTMNEKTTPDILLSSDLDTWLDSLQTAKPGSVKVIYDGDASGSFISPLQPAPDERIIITSTGVDAPAYFSGEGDTCFSSFFWSQVASGATLYNALGYAKQAIAYLSRQGEISFACYDPQSPLIDADGDGTPNEEDDYQIARSRTIGIGMKFADDPPQIGSASVEEELGVVTIVAEDITTTTDLSRVWAVIKPIGYCPGYSGEETQEFGEVELIYTYEGSRYESTSFTPPEAYKVNVYAMDVDGNTSLPKETKVYQAAGGDIYEDPDNDDIFDDERSEANVIVPGHPTPQPHTFHYPGDEDWVKFYGINSEYYTILADNLEANCAPILELYFEDDPVPITVEYTILNNTVSIDFACLEDGIYHVLAHNGTTGEATGYDLQVYYPYWQDPLVLIAGNVEEEGTPNDIDGAVITTDGGGSAISVAGEYEFTQKPGSWWMDAFAYGYSFDGVALPVGTGVEFIQQDIDMTPDAPEDDDEDTVPNDTDNCPYHYNPGQEDTVPPGGDGIGDACAGDKGNVNGGGMDVGDIQMIINIFLITHSPTGYEYWAADCNNDGKISVSDVQIAINKLLSGRSKKEESEVRIIKR